VECVRQDLPRGAGPVALVSDTVVFRLHGARVLSQLGDRPVRPIVVRPGDQSKDRRTLARIQDRILHAGADRTTAVVALGGGVVTDLAGLAAATLLRGLPLFLVPTTLLAAVDAAIGGKTALNTRLGKNLIGSFYWPETVVVDWEFLESLPPIERLQGLAEMIKHGVVADEGLLSELEAQVPALAQGGLPEPDTLRRAAMVKIRVVEEDPFESGRRRILNFGHTVAHAIEAASEFRVTHGSAVAIGMAIEARIAEQVTGFAGAKRLTTLLETLGLPTRPPIPFRAALPFLRRDKKAVSAQIRLSLPRALGAMEDAGGEYAIRVPEHLIERHWR